jgi:asparagine synthase (glutamine-hydrolysing)
MANIVAIVDAETDRRRRFMQQVRDEIAPVEALRLGSVECGDFSAVWAARQSAPISTTVTPTSTALVWGDAIPGPGSERLDAEGLLRAWESPGILRASPFDGFHAALRYDTRQGLSLGADLLGLFPAYYAADRGAIVLGTSPELFRHHPSFPAELSREGLAGLLLTHAVLDGRALLTGVRRLRPGHVLTWRQAAEPLEVLQYTIPAPPPAHGGSFEDDVEELDAAFADAIERHVPQGDATGILLSGGRDSRQLAGYLRARGNPLDALTLGATTDHEVGCATAVARALGCAHYVTDLYESDFTGGAIRQARWEQLATGFSTIHMWGAIAPLQELPPRVVCGHLRDRELEPSPVAFEELLRGARHRGMKAGTLRRLLRVDVFDDLVGHLECRLREVYESGSTVESQRPWRFYLAHGSRSHAGGVPWRLSFGSWPVLPILDRKVLEVISALPDSSLASRRAQDEILRRRFPDLARLPLDRNTDDTLPLVPSVAQRIRHRVKDAVEPIRRRMPRKLERRYYHRIYDINGPGWRAIRRLAEPHRERLADLFDMDVLRELLPPPDIRIAVEHTIRDTFGTKMLIGLMLWSADHLS